MHDCLPVLWHIKIAVNHRTVVLVVMAVETIQYAIMACHDNHVDDDEDKKEKTKTMKMIVPTCCRDWKLSLLWFLFCFLFFVFFQIGQFFLLFVAVLL